MQDFLFKSPTKILFGEGKSLGLGTLLKEEGYTKALVVTDPFIAKLAPFLAVIHALEAEGFSYEVFTDVVVDPPVKVVDAAALSLKQTGADVLVAVGGGSAIDSAKAMAMLARNEGSVKDYLFGGTRTVKERPLPLIALPTTAGSGSEVTASSVITEEETGDKLSVTHEYLAPKYAIIDPLLHLGMPAFITATTGMDALTHAIEAYVSQNANPICDAYCEKAISLIGKYLRTATYRPQDLEARSQMAVASTMAATAFLSAGLGAVHGIAQSIGGIAHVAHGVANALLLPHVMAVNVVGNRERFAHIATLLAGKTEGLSLVEQSDLAVTLVAKLGEDLRIPRKLSEVAVTEDMFPEIVKATMAYRLLPLNPVKLTEEDVYGILKAAY